MAEWQIAVLGGLLVVALFKLHEIADHLKGIRNHLKWLSDGRMENEAFIDRLHKITISSEASAEHLKSIEERIEPFTKTRLQQLFTDLTRAVGLTEKSVEKKSDD